MTEQNEDQWKEDFQTIIDNGLEKAIDAMREPLDDMEKELRSVDRKMYGKIEYDLPKMRKELVSYIRSSIPKATKKLTKKINSL